MTYQPSDRTLNKVDVANTQLDAAIQAYGRGEDVVAVTLACAARALAKSAFKSSAVLALRVRVALVAVAIVHS